MKDLILYIHGKGGNAQEAEHYKRIFPHWDVIGMDYQSQTPWEAKKEFPILFESYQKEYKKINVIANSIGAFFAMNALTSQSITKAFFISPIVDMEKLISDMLLWANITENELEIKKIIPTSFGETLSWDYLCYVRENPIKWPVFTSILYGEKDHLTSLDTIKAFTAKTDAELTVMKNGEHWFHTEEQMSFLDQWLKKSIK